LSEIFDDSTLSLLAAAFIDADVKNLCFDPISTGKHNSSYWVSGAGERFVLRIAPADDAGFLFYERQMMRQEPGLHELIRAHTTIPVADIAGFDFGRGIIDRDYLLMHALPGRPLSDVVAVTREQRATALRQVGTYLRQLHTLTANDCLGVDAYGYLGAHSPMKPQTTWADAFRSMWNLLLDDIAACGAYSHDEAQTMRDLLERHALHFERPVSPTLLHMDVWSQNILVDHAGNVTGLVDFDRALWGDVEIEFAVLDYCGISKDPFWEGYGATRNLSPSAMIRRQFYLLYEVQKYMPIHVWRRNDVAGALRYKQQSFKLASAL
jgi:fructosamine-3-kinase